MEIILKYFPDLSDVQIQQFEKLKELYSDWNSKINVISRKDIDNLYERHVLHSLGIAKVAVFQSGSRILDVGTGGGFPGIPLAIMFPEVSFHLVDSIAKKIKVVDEISKSLLLHNVSSKQIRAEQIRNSYHAVVSRAVTTLPLFIQWVNPLIIKGQGKTGGIYYLKGENVLEELKTVHYQYRIYPLDNYLKESFFRTKILVHIFGF